MFLCAALVCREEQEPAGHQLSRTMTVTKVQFGGEACEDYFLKSFLFGFLSSRSIQMRQQKKKKEKEKKIGSCCLLTNRTEMDKIASLQKTTKMKLQLVGLWSNVHCTCRQCMTQLFCEKRGRAPSCNIQYIMLT